jgi:hypothetical protein
MFAVVAEDFHRQLGSAIAYQALFRKRWALFTSSTIFKRWFTPQTFITSGAF